MNIVVVRQQPKGLEKREIELPVGSCVADALKAVAIEVGEQEAISIWNESAQLGSVLENNDRVDISGALIVDPKEARRLRAESRRATITRKRRHAKT